MGGSADEQQLLNLVKINLSSEWRKTLADYHWETATMDGLYAYMDLKLEILFPPLKRIVHLLTSLKKSPQESHVQYLEWVKTAMLTGGVGSKNSFSLTWDKMIIVLVITGISNGVNVN